MKTIAFTYAEKEEIISLLKKARGREAKVFIEELKEFCSRIDQEEDIWELGRIIQFKQKTMRLRNENSNLALVLARLYADNWIGRDELLFLRDEVQAAIIDESEMWCDS